MERAYRDQTERAKIRWIELPTSRFADVVAEPGEIEAYFARWDGRGRRGDWVREENLFGPRERGEERHWRDWTLWSLVGCEAVASSRRRP